MTGKVDMRRLLLVVLVLAACDSATAPKPRTDVQATRDSLINVPGGGPITRPVVPPVQAPRP